MIGGQLDVIASEAYSACRFAGLAAMRAVFRAIAITKRLVFAEVLVDRKGVITANACYDHLVCAGQRVI